MFYYKYRKWNWKNENNFKHAFYLWGGKALGKQEETWSFDDNFSVFERTVVL